MARRSFTQIAIAALLVAVGAPATLAQSTAITYQGQLKDGGSVVNSPSDFRFSLFNAPSGGTQVGSTVTRNGIAVTDGLFTTPVDFGVNPYTSNQSLFLQIEVRTPAGVGSFVTMGARQLLTPAPFSLATRGINVTSGNQVGIGTTSAQSSFHVVGTGFSTVGNVPYGIFETAANSSADNQFGPQLRLKHGGPGGQEWVMVSGGSGNGPTGAFQLVRQGAPAAALAADSAGWLGVGRSTPVTGFATEAFGVGVKSGNTGYNGLIVDSAANTGLPYFGYSVGGNLRGWTTMTSSGNLDVYTGGGVQRATVTASGNVGIGTGDPQARLHNTGTTRLDGALQFGATLQNGNTLSWGRFDGGPGSTLATLDISPVTVANSSAFAISRNGAQVFLFQMDGLAGKPGGGTWAVLSDERTKTDIQPMTGTLDRLLQLKGHAYTYKREFVQEGRALPGTQIGLVAQEVEAIFPDWVTTGPDGMKQVTERSTTALMVEALRDLRTEKDAEIDALKTRLEKLEAVLASQAK